MQQSMFQVTEFHLKMLYYITLDGEIFNLKLAFKPNANDTMSSKIFSNLIRLIEIKALTGAFYFVYFLLVTNISLSG